LKTGAIAEPSALDQTFAAVMQITGDPLPYGIAPNRRELEAIAQYSVEQGIVSTPPRIEEMFAKGTLDLVG
jgi:4,5-dihydroxyphthalate decarboxylase